MKSLAAFSGNGEARLLMVGLGVMGLPYLHAAHEHGMQVTVLDTAHNMRYSKVADLLAGQDEVVTVAGSAPEHWYQAAAGLTRTFAAVHAFSEPHVVPAAMLAEHLGLPGPGLAAVVISRNKAYQRALFGSRGLPQPEYVIVEDPAEARAWAAGRYPVVGKPVDSYGSAGVRILSGPPDLAEWLATLPARGAQPFLLESFVDGPEFSVEAMVFRGEIIFTNITRKFITEPPYCVEIEHHAPARCPPEQEERLATVLAGVVRALGCQNCLVHLEVRMDTGRPRIMEVAVRTPGDHLMEVVGLAHGLDMFAAALLLAVGRRPVLPSGRPRAAACWFPLAEGRITAIEGAEALRAEPGTELLRIYAEPGTVMPPVRSSANRLGVVVISAPDAAQCAQRLARAKQLLRVETSTE